LLTSVDWASRPHTRTNSARANVSAGNHRSSGACVVCRVGVCRVNVECGVTGEVGAVAREGRGCDDGRPRGTHHVLRQKVLDALGHFHRVLHKPSTAISTRHTTHTTHTTHEGIGETHESGELKAQGDGVSRADWVIAEHSSNCDRNERPSVAEAVAGGEQSAGLVERPLRLARLRLMPPERAPRCLRILNKYINNIIN
jgi:hypothetical protein